MGTTLTAAIVRDDEVAFGHVGDSRAYLFRDGQLKRLTKDHSLVEELRRQGRLTEEQAEEHPQRSIITRALGPEAERERRHDDLPGARRGRLPALQRRPHHDGPRGRDPADPVESKSLRSAVSKLVDAANQGGGRDNITAVAFRRRGRRAKEGRRARH